MSTCSEHDLSQRTCKQHDDRDDINCWQCSWEDLRADNERLREACNQMLYHASLKQDERGSRAWEEDCERMRKALEEKP